MSAAEACMWCGEPATTTAPYRSVKLPACALHKAQAGRKNLYMPCVISADFEAMAPEEQARVWKQTAWADNITNAEWPVVLGHEGVRSYVRSKLKRKAVGWVMALSRILWLRPELGAQVLREADALYREQIREEPPVPWALLADLLESGWAQGGLQEWLQPLGNLRRFHPGHLHALADEAVASGLWERES